MKKWIALLTALMMLFTLTSVSAESSENVTITLSANPTTGFSWTGFVVGGNAVILDTDSGVYVSDPAPANMVGVGGNTTFTVIPVEPGRSIITFTYARPWEPETYSQVIYLAIVDENMALTVEDITDRSVISGTVVTVNEEDLSVTLYADAHGEIIARFEEADMLPVEGEYVYLYTDGTMTMSLPAIVNVIAWGAYPSELARTEDDSADIAENKVTLSFDANATTPYFWTGFVAGGDAVVLDSDTGVYISDPNPDLLDGVGGTTQFTITAVAPGRSILTFNYGQSWEDFDRQEIYLAIVDEELNLSVTNVTDRSVIFGEVTEVNAEDHSVMVFTEIQGDFVARFEDDMALPVLGEIVKLYTDGTMTMSLPPIVNVITWSTVPSELAREEEPVAWEEADYSELVALEAADILFDLAEDQEYVKLLSMGDEILSRVSNFAAARADEPLSIRKLTNIASLKALLGMNEARLSDVAEMMMEQRLYSATTLATQTASLDGVYAVAATSAMIFSGVCEEALPNSIYLLEYNNQVGVIVGIWNKLVTAGFIPNVTVFETNEELAVLFQ